MVEAHAQRKSIERHSAVFAAVEETGVVTMFFQQRADAMQVFELSAIESLVAQVGQARQDRRRRVDRAAPVGKAILKINPLLSEGVQEGRVAVMGVADAGITSRETFDDDDDDIIMQLSAGVRGNAVGRKLLPQLFVRGEVVSLGKGPGVALPLTVNQRVRRV